jgi:hypothetical protein
LARVSPAARAIENQSIEAVPVVGRTAGLKLAQSTQTAGGVHHVNGEQVYERNWVAGRRNTNILTAGPRGPALLQDIWLIEKMAHFDREVIPERRMHAKGWGAYGTFTVTHDITRYTKAKIFSEIGKQTPMFARFSTVAGEARRGGCGAGHTRLCPQVLHGGGQLATSNSSFDECRRGVWHFRKCAGLDSHFAR